MLWLRPRTLDLGQWPVIHTQNIDSLYYRGITQFLWVTEPETPVKQSAHSPGASRLLIWSKAQIGMILPLTIRGKKNVKPVIYSQEQPSVIIAILVCIWTLRTCLEALPGTGICLTKGHPL